MVPSLEEEGRRGEHVSLNRHPCSPGGVPSLSLNLTLHAEAYITLRHNISYDNRATVLGRPQIFDCNNYETLFMDICDRSLAYSFMPRKMTRKNIT